MAKGSIRLKINSPHNLTFHKEKMRLLVSYHKGRKFPTHYLRGGHMAEEDEIIQSLKQHDERLINLEEADKTHTARLQIVETNYTNLENTILKENRDTRTFFQNTMDRQWDIISGKSQYADAESQRNHDLKKTKIERYSEITLKIVGAGGLLIIVAQALLQ